MTDPLQVLRDIFGFSQFRGEQEAIVKHVVGGGSALVLMPTGGGKSLCYQIPALVREGVGIVISPLISLMQDQVQALLAMDVRAAYLNSSVSSFEQREIETRLVRGELDLLYVAPERAVTPGFLSLLARATIALVAIDEAHCISQWGHDFRPEYAQLSTLRQKFSHIPFIALTATADEVTRRDIRQQLSLLQSPLFLASFDRPNIQYNVALRHNARAQLKSFIAAHHPEDAGIVYCLSRKKVEETANWLVEEGFKAVPYHAGLDADVRRKNQQRFQREEGMIVVATIAFGMGIDKPNVRFVAHLDLPKSIENYYQETGRAGRDGLPATAWMVYGLADVVTLRQMLAQSEADAAHQQLENRKLAAMLGYCETVECRRKVLLRYFNETVADRCGNCDMCLEPTSTWDGTVAAQKALSAVYRTGQRFGAAYLIDVLLGKMTDRIQSFGHHELKTFGIGKELDAAQWHSVFRQLVAAGSLMVDMDAYGGLKLTTDSADILKGIKPIQFRVDARPAAKAKKAGKSGNKGKSSSQSPVEITTLHGDALWERLRECRLELSRKAGVPPYVIFHDTTLKEMVKYRPKKLQDMRALTGVGETKLARYGDVFLQVLRDYWEEGVNA